MPSVSSSKQNMHQNWLENGKIQYLRQFVHEIICMGSCLHILLLCIVFDIGNLVNKIQISSKTTQIIKSIHIFSIFYVDVHFFMKDTDFQSGINIIMIQENSNSKLKIESHLGLLWIDM